MICDDRTEKSQAFKTASVVMVTSVITHGLVLEHGKTQHVDLIDTKAQLSMKIVKHSWLCHFLSNGRPRMTIMVVHHGGPSGGEASISSAA